MIEINNFRKKGLIMGTASDRGATNALIERLEENEKHTEIQFREKRELDVTVSYRDLTQIDVMFDFYTQRVYYVSDLHLMHRIRNAHCKSQQDVENLLTHIAETIMSEASGLLLINGDVSSDLSIFKKFVDILSHHIQRHTLIVFTLGNHEFWNFEGKEIEDIVQSYRKILAQYGMYLLHNDLLYRTETGIINIPGVNIHLIHASELQNSDEQTLKDTLRKARTVIWGGTGFSGYNLQFNANDGIYRRTISRNEEVQYSSAFENTYRKLLPILKDNNAIIMTHMPLEDWCKTSKPQEGIFYLSGHTHKNIFYDDGAYHIYADNQIGYHHETVQVKSFLMNNEYDLFFDYPDGIHKITAQQYRDFYRGKNIKMDFNREIDIWMLKKEGYYCFIVDSTSGKLLLLNGGAQKSLKHNQLDYYFENMDRMIAAINAPLTKYTGFQRKVASLVKKIGGEGYIHGCIIDIDFYNHIYVNPFDGTVTGYWAQDIIYKKVYPSVPALLEEQCPKYLVALNRLSETEDNEIFALKTTGVMGEGQLDPATDIYKASREIRKMQKLGSRILSTWPEHIIDELKKLNQPSEEIEKGK